MRNNIAWPLLNRRSFFITAFICAIAAGVGLGLSMGHMKARQNQQSKQQAIHHTISDDAQPTDQISPLPESTAAERHVPILMYHYIRVVTDPKDTLGFNLSVTPANFDQQLHWLASNGYVTYPLNDFCHGKVPESGKPVILTFDDGYDDADTAALPSLQKNHLSGTFFIVAGFLGKPHYLSYSQLHDLANAGMELGAHTVHHIDLATASVDKQQQEIAQSKQSSPVFAYPAGRYSENTISIVKQNDFTCAVTTHPGIATEKSPLYELPRVRISGADTLQQFAEKVQGIK